MPFDFVNKITGVSLEDLKVSGKQDPMIWVAAIVAYLEGENAKKA